jgi:hypothetical protein
LIFGGSQNVEGTQNGLGEKTRLATAVNCRVKQEMTAGDNSSMFPQDDTDMARRRVMPYNSTLSSLVDAVILTAIAGHLETVAAYTFSCALTSQVLQ